MEYKATLVKHPSEDNVKNDFFLVGPLVPMRINWLPRKFSVLNFGKQSVKLIIVFFVSQLYICSFYFWSKSFIRWHGNLLPEFHIKVLWKDIELLVTEFKSELGFIKKHDVVTDALFVKRPPHCVLLSPACGFISSSTSLSSSSFIFLIYTIQKIYSRRS